VVVNRQYYSSDEAVFTDAGGGFAFSALALETAIRSVYENELNLATEVERNLFSEFWRAFTQATNEGFGAPVRAATEYPLYEMLQHNNAVFSAFRAHRMQNDIAAQLTDADGKLRSFAEFRDAVKQFVAPTHLEAWLQTEYSTAIRRAHMAAQWKKFEGTADILPNLEWMPTTSLSPHPEHRLYWHVIRPITDKFWKEHCPGDRWNCKCDLEATDKDVTPIPKKDDEKKSDQPSAGLEGNPAADGRLFSDKHPHIANAYPGAWEAVDNFIKENVTPPTTYKVTRFKKGGVLETANLPYHGQNKHEIKNNLMVYTRLAELFGQRYRLLPLVHEAKSPDAVNLINGYLSDAKIPVTTNGQNAIQASIRSASKQKCDEVVIMAQYDYDRMEVQKGLRSALIDGRAETVKEVVIMFPDGEIERYNTDTIRTTLKKAGGKP
jgi:hypothetical protein